MSLTSNFIHELTPSRPDLSEDAREGALWLQTIQRAIQGTFPTDLFDKALTVTADYLNSLPSYVEITDLETTPTGIKIVFDNNNYFTLTLNGGVLSNTLSMSNKQIKDLATPTDDTDAVNKKFIDDILSNIYPVGSLYMSSVGTLPATLAGIGTWGAYATGQALVGQGSYTDSAGTNQTFVAGSVTGVYEAELPEHDHKGYVGQRFERGGAATAAVLLDQTYSDGNVVDDVDNTIEAAPVTTKEGIAGATNVQPSMPIYVWKRLT
jgi:hypothetical protein